MVPAPGDGAGGGSAIAPTLATDRCCWPLGSPAAGRLRDSRINFFAASNSRAWSPDVAQCPTLARHTGRVPVVKCNAATHWIEDPSLTSSQIMDVNVRWGDVMDKPKLIENIRPNGKSLVERADEREIAH